MLDCRRPSANLHLNPKVALLHRRRTHVGPHPYTDPLGCRDQLWQRYLHPRNKRQASQAIWRMSQPKALLRHLVQDF